MNPRVYFLAFGTFTVGTEGYLIAGVLPGIARDLHTSVSVGGQLVTVFALAYALGGPPLIGLCHRIAPRRLLVGAALGFAAANVLAAVAQNVTVLVLARLLQAAGAALFMAPAAAASAALSSAEQLPRALSVTATGNALALVAGAPLGTVVGNALGWRASFGLVAALAVLSSVLLGAALPRIASTPTPSSGRLALLTRAPVRWAVLTTLGLFVANYAVYTYLAPLAAASAGLTGAGVAGLMVAFGAGGLLGGQLIGRLLARRALAGVLRGGLLVLVVMCLVLALLVTVHPARQVGTPLVFASMLVMGAAWWCIGIGQQTRMARLAPDRRAQALGLHFGAQFLGVALGGALGGGVLAVAGAAAVPVVSAALAALTMLTTGKGRPTDD